MTSTETRVAVDRNLQYLQYLEDLQYKGINDGDTDIRGYQVRSVEGKPIGFVSDLVVDVEMKAVKYIELEYNDVKSFSKGVTYTPNKFYPPIDKADGKNYKILPVGLIEVDEMRNQVTVDDQLLSNINKSPFSYRKHPITADYEAEVIDIYNDFAKEELNMNIKLGDGLFENGYIKRDSIKDRMFHNHYFGYKL